MHARAALMFLLLQVGLAAGEGPVDAKPRRLRRASQPTAEEPVNAVAAEVAPNGRTVKKVKKGVVKRSGRSDLSSLIQVTVDPDGEILGALSNMDEGPPEPA
mmetsp:Transcript_36791/g.83613  ORF Transcript_36791/g.83613 Transcript_36791/m.83613 type:complete len:102 (-) Transcript_36791:9-314(-)